MIKITQKGGFENAERFFNEGKHIDRRLKSIFRKYAILGVKALRSATPSSSGRTADGWSYKIEKWGIVFSNSNVNAGYSVALLIQYGHATKNGGYVQGTDFINPALQPIFKKLADECWREVKSL